MPHRAHIVILVENRYLTQLQPSGMRAALEASQHRVTVLDPQDSVFELSDPWGLDDVGLVVARGRSWPVLCLLAAAEARGVATINRRASIASVLNKAEMAVMLTRQGISTPETYIGTPAGLARDLGPDRFPLILKPVFGDNCRGLRVVHTTTELEDVDWPEPVVLAQHYVPGDGWDLKLYGIGDEIWGVRKPSPLGVDGTIPGVRPTSGEPPAELVRLSPAQRELGRRCGRVFGLELFGVDCIETTDGPIVIEVNDFPNYTGVPQADQRLAEFVAQRAEVGGPPDYATRVDPIR